MKFRTDIALEAAGELDDIQKKGINKKVREYEDLTITEIIIEDKSISEKLRKPIGTYITAEFSSLSKDYKTLDPKIKIISKELGKLIPKKGLIFVVGLGNSIITPDALGPKVIESIFSTRHIKDELKKSIKLTKLRPVAALSPGVLGQTGIEVKEIISSICDKIAPKAVIIIDALAAKSIERLGTTIQISDTGISPGSGVGNKRPEISSKTIGIPVISIGVPTVIDALTIVNELVENIGDNKNILLKNLSNNAKNMIVTPREIDVLIERSAYITAMAINLALQPFYSLKDLEFLSK